MQEFDNVKKVKCDPEKDVCEVEHEGIVSEVDVEGIMIEGGAVVRGAKTEVDVGGGKCKKYGETLICKKEW